MSNNFKCAIYALGILLLSGCANLNSIHRALGPGEGALIDVKQRAIIPGRLTNSEGTSSVICPEPSPDAMSAYAAEVAAKSEKAGVELGVAGREAASFIGMRTAAIQALRDVNLYNCIGYLNGAVSRENYEIMLRRQQQNTVALIAIEQLTGALMVPNFAIVSESSASTARSVKDLGELIDKTNAELADLQPKIDAAKAGLDEAEKQHKKAVADAAEVKKDDQVAKDDAAKLVADKEKAVKNAKQALDDLNQAKSNKVAIKKASEDGIKNGRGSIAAGKMTLELIANETAGRRSDQHVEKVANVVAGIVKETQTMNEGPALCFARLSMAKGDPNSGLSKYCADLLQKQNEVLAQNVKFLEAMIDQYKDKSTPPEARAKLANDIPDIIRSISDQIGVKSHRKDLKDM